MAYLMSRSVRTPEVRPGVVELEIVDNAFSVEVELIVKEVCGVAVELSMELLGGVLVTVVMVADVDAIDLATAFVEDE